MAQCTSTHCLDQETFPLPCQEHATQVKILRGYRELVLELGGRPDAMLEDAGIAPAAIEHPSARVPFRTLGRLLEDTARQLGCSDFGMRLAERQSMVAVMEPLDRVFCTAPTVRDAFETGINHMSAYNSGLVMELSDGPAGAMHMVDLKLLDGLALFPQLFEQLMLLTHNSIVWLSAGFVRSRKVWFSHLRVSPPIAYARRFNSVIEFGQEFDGLFFTDADMKARLAECSADKFASETRLIEQRFPVQHRDIDMAVRQTVFRVLAQADDCTRRNVAHRLGFQERTLNRRLSKKGTSFEAIRDEVRRNLAYRYLARADLPLTEIAGRLGYSELAVLSRCCRRWFGKSPRRLRQDLLTERTARSIQPARPRRLAA
jgi:AraC-like DNA-binding protein